MELLSRSFGLELLASGSGLGFWPRVLGLCKEFRARVQNQVTGRADTGDSGRMQAGFKCDASAFQDWARVGSSLGPCRAHVRFVLESWRSKGEPTVGLLELAR